MIFNINFQNRIRESELPNKALITDLNNDISNLKKENNTLVTRLEDLRKAVRKLSYTYLFNSINYVISFVSKYILCRTTTFLTN